ncbi:MULTISPECIES: class I SAM-dependent methyltransferase [Streptomyces]|uniref:Methyltransferase domain-containing protein n=1 Tax=Streptomyces harbinensis TaxID=1176198 RepID=A0A1I6UCR4_9ACTN|nr:MULTISPECIES: class I SAM-dependent methyltransferase [Streptomyces]SFS99210.1 Methyltransferase domain-containing protein [Streptomyces harbinensis]
MVSWEQWQESWDRQQEWYLPDREERFRVMLDGVEALAGTEPRVLDLACGTGSISARLLRRFPGATSTGVDLDPALLTIARGTFEGDSRITFVTADLRDPAWTDALPYETYDAVLTSTALHWLAPDALRTLYGQLADLLRAGGLFVNADHMPNPDAPRINAAVHAFTEARQEKLRAEGGRDWPQWWTELAADPQLADVAAERFAIFGNPAEASGDHDDTGARPIGWHIETLRAVGFAEATCAWASLTDAAVLALR